MQTPVPEQLKTVEQKLKLVTANLANAAKQLQNGDIVQPKVIDDIYNELSRLNAEKRALESMADGDGDEALPTDRFMADLETVYTALGVDPKTVQNYVVAGHLVRNARGQYDLLASLVSMNRSRKEAETGKNDAYNEERTAAMRLKRLEREREHEEAMKNLVNYESLLAARERKNADIKQKMLFLEKTLPPRLAMLPANEQEPIIRNEIRKLLTEFAVAPVPGISDRGSGQDIPAASGPDRVPVGRRKKKARKQDKR